MALVSRLRSENRYDAPPSGSGISSDRWELEFDEKTIAIFSIAEMGFWYKRKGDSSQIKIGRRVR